MRLSDLLTSTTEIINARLTFALTLVSLACAQPTGTAKTARIEGTVRDSVTGEPVQYAIVRVIASPMAQLARATDRKGDFVIEDVAPASAYRLTATRSSYMASTYGSQVSGGRGTLLTLSAGQVLRDVVISMAPQGIISGRVTDSEGAAIQGATVVALRSILGANGRQFIANASETTNERGDYRMTDIAPGLYYVCASFRGIVRSEIVAYYPNALDVSEAMPLRVGFGAAIPRIDVRVPSVRTYKLRGKAVIAATAAPAGGFTIRSQPRIDSVSYLSRMETQTHTDGTFELTGLLLGPHTLDVAST